MTKFARGANFLSLSLFRMRMPKVCSTFPESVPTDPSTTLELENPSHDVSDIRQVCRSPDLEALEL